MSINIITNAQILAPDCLGVRHALKTNAIVVEDEKIVWLGSSEDIPVNYQNQAATTIDCDNKLVTPGLIDCHTHLVYGGDRAKEFEMRLQGVDYQTIANQGGGINSTVNDTRNADEESLFDSASKRLNRLMQEGVTTIEIKSGYGLDLANELKMLRVAQRLEQANQIRVMKTFLAAHALPSEYKGEDEAYLDLVVEQMLPAAYAKGLVDAVDGFCEGIAFSVEQMQRVFDKAQQFDLPIKLHAEQLSHLGGAVMAAKRGALSVDHIEYLRAEEAQVLADNKTVAVLLPGAFYNLHETQKPPLQALREQSVAMAVATDLNPGSSPLNSILMAMNMACVLFGLTPAEALAGVTINAAKALGIDRLAGSLELGKQADLVIWDVDHPAVLSYQMGANPCLAVMVAGQWRSNQLAKVLG